MDHDGSTLTHPETSAGRPDPTRRLRRAATTALAVLAPVLFTVSNAVQPPLHGTTAEVVAGVPRVAGRLLAGHLLDALASLMLVALVVALWRIRPRAGSGLRLAGGVLVVVGALGNALGEAVDGYLAWGAARATVPASAQVRLFDLLDGSPAALPISWLAVPVMSVGLLVLLAGIARARVVPVWLPVLGAVGALGAGFVGSGLPALVGLVWSLAVAVIVRRVAAGDPADVPRPQPVAEPAVAGH